MLDNDAATKFYVNFSELEGKFPAKIKLCLTTVDSNQYLSLAGDIFISLAGHS